MRSEFTTEDTESTEKGKEEFLMFPFSVSSVLSVVNSWFTR